MKILIAGALAPYSNRQEKALCEAVEQHYRSQQHTTDLFYLPWEPDFYGAHEQILAYRLLTVYNECDILITVGYPAFALQHPRKYAFLFDFFPAFHTQYGTDYGFKDQFFRVDQDQKMVKNLHQAEKVCLGEARKVFVASSTLQENLQSLACQAERFSFTPTLAKGEPSQVEKGSILVESYLEPLDRIDLLLQAAALMKDKHPIAIMIPASDPQYQNALYERIARLQLQKRVSVYERAVTLTDLQDCSGALSLRRFSEYVPAYVSYALAMGIHCVVPKDGGALCSLDGQSENIFGVSAEEQSIAKSLQRLPLYSTKRKASADSLNADLPKLLEGLVK
ncbi:MAG: hypothetical protein PHI98_00080 [Eubacteriales bacterium]|nr:hypothetical protein [Eubacteriales bacterium]